MKTKSMFVRLGLAMMFGAMTMSGCGQGTPDSSLNTIPNSSRETYVKDLVNRYRAVEPNQDKQEKTLQEVDALRGDDARLFNNEIRRLQPQASEGMDWLVDEYIQYLNEKGVTFLPREESERVYKEILHRHSIQSPASATSTSASSLLGCYPGQVVCSYVNFPEVAGGGSCGFGCTSATGSDRTSNEQCEWGACDHRIWFPTSKNALAGLTADARCVILKYGGLISRYDSGRREVLSGIGGPLDCHIYWDVNTYLRNNFVVF